MNTGNFNWLDKVIAALRLGQVSRFIQKDDVVLDFGCGVQHYLLTHGQGKFKTGYGLDYDVTDSRHGNITLLKHRYQGQLPFDAQTFDRIFMLAVLEHIEVDRVPALLKEFDRILKPDGQIVLTTPTPKGQVVLEFLAFKLKIISREEIADHKHYYIENEVSRLVQSCGLRLVKFKSFQFGWNSLYVIEKQGKGP